MGPFKKLFTFSPGEIDRAFKQARQKKYHRGLKLLEAQVEQTEATHGKLLVIIPATSGKAHDRNRLRRQARSIFYEEKLYQRPIFWILLVQKRAIFTEFEELKMFLKEAMQ